jgi:hypothetical protein
VSALRASRLSELGPLALLGAAALYVVWVAQQHGPLALSDDDYARLAIALDAARTPRLDPSGTSWLPAPFWLYGFVLRSAPSAGAAPIDVARTVPFALACIGTWLVYAGARSIGLTRCPAALGALAGLGVHSVAQLAGLCVPEHPAAALCTFALLARFGRRRELGALASIAIAIASLCRYEAWPVAVVVALAALVRGPSARGSIEAAVALSGIALWLVHNQLVHGDALHFLGRVAAYREALGARGDRAGVLRGYGRALVGESPALVLALAVILAAGVRRMRLHSLAPWLGVVAMLGFLLAGALVGGVPTHHVGRALSALFLLGGVYSAARPALAGLLALTELGLLPWTIGRSDGFSRRAEEELGRLARDCARGEARLLVATPDYGYFAVLAAFGDTARSDADQRHDPREPDPPSRLGDAAALEALRAAGVRCVVAPTLPGTRELARRGKLGLYTL